MKRDRHAFIIAAAGMLLVIGFISVMSIAAARREGYSDRPFAFSLGGRAKLRNTIEIPVEKASRLKLEYGNKNIKIYPAEDEQIIIKEYLYSGNKRALAEVTYSGESEVLVAGGRSRIFVVFGFFAGEGERIEVYIPEKSLKELSAQTGSGNITLQADCTEKDGILEMQAGSGNIELENAEAKEISLETNSGNIKAKRLEGERIRFQAGSGNIRGEEAVGTVCAEAGSGNIKIEKLSGGGSISAGSGNVTVEAEKVSGDMEYGTGSGNIKLQIPRELKFYFEADTGSGNIYTDFDEHLSYDKKGKSVRGDIGDSPTVRIAAETGSGNINIKYR